MSFKDDSVTTNAGILLRKAEIQARDDEAGYVAEELGPNESPEDKPSKFDLIKKMLMDQIYPSLILKHLDYTSLKTIFRSWLMMWAVTLLFICRRTEEFMGPSAFLANFAGGIEIAGNLSISAAFVFGMSDMASIMFACLISVITMAINWKIRGNPSEDKIISSILSHGFCKDQTSPNFENCILPLMHHGHFLNIKTTVVTIFGMLFTFTLCGQFQSVSKYGKLAWLLNSLFTIIVFTFNNMMPVWRPWYYARNVVVPMSMAVCARFAISILVFPTSSNHKLVTSFSTAAAKLAQTCQHIREKSIRHKPSDHDFKDAFEFIEPDTQSIYRTFIVNEIDMDMVSHLEIWFSRFTRFDLIELQSQTRLIMSSLSGFSFFYRAMSDKHLEIKFNTSATFLHERKNKAASAHQREHKWTPKSLQKHLQRTYKPTGIYESRERMSSHSKERTSKEFDLCTLLANPSLATLDGLDSEFKKIVESHDALLNLSNDLLREVSRWLFIAGELSWIRPWSKSEKLEIATDYLRNSVKAHTSILAEARKTFTPRDQLVALHGYMSAHFAQRVQDLAYWCLELHKKRPRPILVWPLEPNQGKFTAAPTVKDFSEIEYDGYDKMAFATSRGAFKAFEPQSEVQARNPDSGPSRTFWHIIGRGVEIARDSLYDGDLLFSIKRAVLTVATLTLYFCRPTCDLAYRNWFVWVAILTTYTVARQAVDGAYGLLGKLIYTFYGCLVGMVGWYICAGSGRGNPYGYAAVTAFIWLYICFQRQYNSHFMPALSIVFACTVSLVLGNSWSGGHVALAGVDLGKGFKVAWIRFVTVSVGLCVSFLGTIFPKIYTAKKAVRQIVGVCLEHLGELHSAVANFGIERYRSSSTHIVAHRDVVTKTARSIITNLDSAEVLRKRLIFEPPLSGFYPTKSYKLLIALTRDVALLYSLIYSFFDETDETEHLPDALKMMGWSNSRLCSDVFSILYMTSRALSDAEPLPSITPGNLSEKYVCDLLDTGYLELSKPVLESSEGKLLVTAIALSVQLYERLDLIMILIKDLVGEVYNFDMSIFDLEKQPLSEISDKSVSLGDSLR